MNTFYFTYGSEGQPYVGGWTTVDAEDFDQACELFCLIHPRKDGFINCAGIYYENDFKETRMYKNNNNLGQGCVETISLKVTKLI